MARLEVEILSRRLIKPSIPTPNNLRKLKLSLFDQFAPRIYVDIIYYYSGGGDEIGTDDATARRCAGLEKSLSDALVHLYPFAGRFNKQDVSVDCGDQGAEFWQARVRCKLSEFLQRAPYEIELVDQLLPWEIPPAVDSPTSPQLGIQVNAFDDGGIVVAVRTSHILSDAATMSLLVKTWAAAASRDVSNNINIVQNPGLRHEIAHLFPANSSSTGFNHPVISAPPPSNEADKIVTRRFLISSRLLTIIKNGAAASYTTSDGKRQPSRVVVALALVWKSLMGVSMAKHGHVRDSALSIPINLRGKVSLGMKETQNPFGNFFISLIVSFVANNRAHDDVDLSDLITFLSHKIAEANAKIATASRDELVTMKMNSRKEVVAKCNRSDSIDVYFCSSWYGALPVYETDLGWGKPKWASIATQPGAGVCLMDSCDNDGIQLWVSLKQIEMVPFRQQFYKVASISNL